MIEEYNNIKNPKELLEFMNQNIEYGFYGSDNKIHTPDSKDFNEEFDKYWVLCDKDRLLKYKYGNCYDQVELEKDWFKSNNYEFKTFFIYYDLNFENDYFTHTYLAYKENDKWYYFEHADYNNRGIHEFNSLNELKEFQKNKFIEFNKASGRKINEKINSKIKIVEYNITNHNINCDEFYEYMC